MEGDRTSYHAPLLRDALADAAHTSAATGWIVALTDQIEASFR